MVILNWIVCCWCWCWCIKSAICGFNVFLHATWHGIHLRLDSSAPRNNMLFINNCFQFFFRHTKIIAHAYIPGQLKSVVFYMKKWTIHSGVELMDFVVVIVMSFSLWSHISYRYILWFISKDRWIWPRKFLRLTPSDYENNKSLKPIGIKSHLLLWQLTLNTLLNHFSDWFVFSSRARSLTNPMSIHLN